MEKKQAVLAAVLPTHTPELFRDAVQRAAELLRAGEAVALPTETVYGLAANALDAKAVERIFQIKGRPAHNPIIVHVASGRRWKLSKEWVRHVSVPEGPADNSPTFQRWGRTFGVA